MLRYDLISTLMSNKENVSSFFGDFRVRDQFEDVLVDSREYVIHSFKVPNVFLMLVFSALI